MGWRRLVDNDANNDDDDNDDDGVDNDNDDNDANNDDDDDNNDDDGVDNDNDDNDDGNQGLRKKKNDPSKPQNLRQKDRLETERNTDIAKEKERAKKYRRTTGEKVEVCWKTRETDLQEEEGSKRDPWQRREKWERVRERMVLKLRRLREKRKWWG